jgi:hypothetical protein
MCIGKREPQVGDGAMIGRGRSQVRVLIFARPVARSKYIGTAIAGYGLIGLCGGGAGAQCRSRGKEHTSIGTDHE